MLRNPPSALTEEEYMALYGGIYEHSPWVAAAARGCDGIDTADGLHAAMAAAVDAADTAQKLALLRAHPRLACKPADLPDMAAASVSEQKGAGLDHCTPEEFLLFGQFNDAYAEKFGFPFIVAVKGLTRQDILAQFRARLDNAAEDEFATALAQVHKIALFRLRAMEAGA